VHAETPLRVVLDTNILVAAFQRPGGSNAALWRAARHGKYTLISSPALGTELARVLRTDFSWPESRVQRRVRAVARAAELVQPRERVQAVAADPDDNRVLECAIAGRGDLIVSNDRHLRDLESFRGIPIVSGLDFRRILGVWSLPHPVAERHARLLVHHQRAHEAV
jgi:putative PIN family toxin of toxin-antitoxin system